MVCLCHRWRRQGWHPQLFHTDPSGTFTSYKAKSIGVGSEGAQTELIEKYSDELSLEQAEDLALSILKHVMEENVTTKNIEYASVTPASGYKLYSTDDVQAVIDRATAAQE